jgi:hypothetical protein
MTGPVIPKPDFIPKWGRYEWNTDRVEYVRYCAETRKMTAAEIAAETGIDREHVIRAVAQRYKIRFANRGAKRPPRSEICIELDEGAQKVFGTIALKHGMNPQQILAALVDAVTSEGAVYLDNLLDLEA